MKATLKLLAQIIICGFLFTACAPATLVTPTSYPIAVLRPQIEPLLYQDKDLPENWKSGSYATTLPADEKFRSIFPDLVVVQEIINISYAETGYIAVMIFQTPSSFETAKSALVVGSPITSLGETSAGRNLGDKYIEVTFARCNAIIQIYSYGPLIEDLAEYARRVDGRIIPIICK